ncbi:MAG: hypothetical protein QOE90_370 [Thermoplasmata archaeon]|nr:hypothetical protein [Thermoplasmata archaeon]
MKAATIALILLAITLVVSPALAQGGNTTVNNNYNNPTPSGGTPQVNVNNPTPVVNVNNPQQSTAGLDTTTILVIVVVAVLVIALVVGLAGRNRWW